MHPAHKQQRQGRLVLTLWVPLDKHGCLNRSTQDRADISLQSLVSFQHFNETEERCYKCFLATAPRKRFPLHSVSSPRWELPPSLSHGLQHCTTCLVPETHSNSPDSSSCLLSEHRQVCIKRQSFHLWGKWIFYFDLLHLRLLLKHKEVKPKSLYLEKDTQHVLGSHLSLGKFGNQMFSQLVRQESCVEQDLTSDDISCNRQGAPKSLCAPVKAFMPEEVCLREVGLKSGQTPLCLGLWGTRQHHSGWICPLEYTDVSPSSFTRPRFPLNQELNADLHINLRRNLEDDWKCERTFESDPPPLRMAPFTRLLWGWMGSETRICAATSSELCGRVRSEPFIPEKATIVHSK